MKMRKIRPMELPFSAPQGLRMLFLCGFFLLGAVIGHIAARFFGSDLQLSEALFDRSSWDATPPVPSVWQVFVAYFRFPLLALLLGYCTFSFSAVPLLIVLQGFSLSFATSALTLSLGPSGIPLVLASFGLRSLITIICTLILALRSLERGSKQGGGSHHNYSVLCICLFLLILGIVLEITVMPSLFSSALARLQSY